MTQPPEQQEPPPSKAQQAVEAVAAYEAVKAAAPDPFLPLRWAKLAAIIRWERKLAPTFRRLIRDYVPEMASKATAHGVVDPVAAFAVKHEFTQAVKPIVEIEVRELVEDAFHHEAPAADWDPDSASYVTRYLDAAFNRLVNVPDRVYNQVRDEMKAAFAKGYSVDELAERIHEVLGRNDAGMWESRAMVIARTEMIGAYNAGTFAGMVASAKQDGGQWVKGWLSTEDSRVRPTHAAADFHTGALKQIVPLTAPFQVGGFPLMFPGDPTGPPQEVIQCRCTLVMMRPGEMPSYSNKHFKGQS